MSSAQLYNAQVLGLATSLAAYPLSADLPLRGLARSATCGSVIELGLDCDSTGQITRVGLRAQACAIGQAAAAIFAAAAPGTDKAGVAGSLAEIEHWLGGSELPMWPGFEAIAPARAYPARHGALLLSWRAALVALAGRG